MSLHVVHVRLLTHHHRPRRYVRFTPPPLRTDDICFSQAAWPRPFVYRGCRTYFCIFHHDSSTKAQPSGRGGGYPPTQNFLVGFVTISQVIPIVLGWSGPWTLDPLASCVPRIHHCLLFVCDRNNSEGCG